MDSRTDGDAFLRWATDPVRTFDERMGLEYMLDQMTNRWPKEAGDEYRARDYRIREAARARRSFNPRHEPVVDAWRLENTAKVLASVKELSISVHEGDPPLRDLGFLRFLPSLEQLYLHKFEGETLDQIAAAGGLPELRMMHMRSSVVEDFSGLAACPQLRSLCFHCGVPWPRLKRLEDLPQLKSLEWHGPSVAFLDVKRLPALRWLHAGFGHHGVSGCARDFFQLPEMPELDFFWGGPLWRLDGVAAQCPKLRTLVVEGEFGSLEPLRALERLTHLRLCSGKIDGLGAVAALPRLRQFILIGQRPQDFTPLLEAAELSDLRAFGCDVAQPDLEMVQHVLPPWDDLFQAAEPRPLGPLRLHVVPVKNREAATRPSTAFPEGPEGWDGCLSMHESEHEWVFLRVRDALEASGLTRVRGVEPGRLSHEKTLDYYDMENNRRKEMGAHAAWFGDVPGAAARGVKSRCVAIELLGAPALGHLRAVIDCVRPVLARCRHAWQFMVQGYAEPHAEMFDRHTFKRQPTPQERVMEEIEIDQYCNRQREREQAFLAEELRLKVLREDGIDPPPGTPPWKARSAPQRPGAPLQEAGTESAEEETSTPTYNPEEDSAEGGVAETEPGREPADEHWLPPPPALDPNVDWSALGYFHLYLAGDTVWLEVFPHSRRQMIAGLEYLLGVPAHLAEGETRENEKSGG